MTTQGRVVTILLVEDDVDNRIIMQAWLEHAGYPVQLAGDGGTSLTPRRRCCRTSS